MSSARTTDRLVLSIRGLRKEFRIHTIDRRVLALAGIDLSVSRGEHVTLVGASGAGKSTVLRCIWRSCLPTDGEVRFHREDGETIDLTRLSDNALADLREREMGYVSQFLRADRRRSVLDVVARVGVRRGLDRTAATDAAADALARVRLPEKLWQTHPSVLSGGEQQRVNLAAGTLASPRLVLLDEPVASLDTRHRDSALDLISELGRQGTTVISVFHDLEAVAMLATRVVKLGSGRIIADGLPREILHPPGRSPELS